MMITAYKYHVYVHGFISFIHIVSSKYNHGYMAVASSLA